jgi:hypothetical protein
VSNKDNPAERKSSLLVLDPEKGTFLTILCAIFIFHFDF